MTPGQDPTRVVIFGSAGRTGRLIAQAAARDRHEVTAAVRRPEQLTRDTFPTGVNVIRAALRVRLS